MTTRQALWTVIGVSTMLRLALAACMGADTNEAYYYAYAKHPDLSYFDHPPMVAAVVRLGLLASGGAGSALAIRAGFLAMFAASTWLLARLTARFFGPRAGVLAALALNVTGYFGLVVGSTAQPDGPLLFFWLLTLDRLAAALAEPRKVMTWLVVGLGCGGAMLSKYYAGLLPIGAVFYLALRPEARRCLKTPGPYLAVAVSLAAFSPVILWNAGHDWASFQFQGQRAVGSTGFQPLRLVEALGGQILYLLPWMWAALVASLFRVLKCGPRRWSDAEAFLVSQSVPALGFFLGVASFRGIMPHWPLIGFVAVMPLLGRDWSGLLDRRPVLQRRRLAAYTAAPLVLALLIVAQARFGALQDGRGNLFGLMPARQDPTLEYVIWDPIARELKRRGLLDAPGTFLFTDSWRRSAQLDFSTRHAVPVACFNRDARSFAFWSRPGDWVGRDGIFVSVEDRPVEPRSFGDWFDHVEPLDAFSVVRAGVPVQTVRLYRCVRQTRPYPFLYGIQLGRHSHGSSVR